MDTRLSKAVAGCIVVLVCLGGLSCGTKTIRQIVDRRHPAQLQGCWKVQRGGNPTSTVDRNTWWILRGDGTFQIVKKGRKPRGQWEVDDNNKLIFRGTDRTVMQVTWHMEGETLVAEYDGKTVMFAKSEPPDPATLPDHL